MDDDESSNEKIIEKKAKDLEPIPLKLKRFGADSVSHKDKVMHLNKNGHSTTQFPIK